MKAPPTSPLCEETARKQPSVKQKEDPYQEPTNAGTLTSDLTASSRNGRNKDLLQKPPSFGNFLERPEQTKGNHDAR